MDTKMWITENSINASEGYGYGDSGWYETDSSDQGELFRSMRGRDYGRCTGKVYLDDAAGESHHVGWVFQQRRKYDDCAKTYLAEAWVTFRKGAPEPHCATCGAVHGSGRGVAVIQ